MHARRLFAAVALTFAAVAGCDKVTPVAPANATLTVSANPTFIEVDGESIITIIGRGEDGLPVNEGTEILLSTTLGTIDRSVFTDERGVAEAVLRGDGRPGLAEVVVSSGAVNPITLDPPIQIGAFATFISLQVTPPTVDENGGELEIVALVRGDTGAPLADAVVNFSSPFGVLASAGGAIITDANGEARDTLTLLPTDVASVTGTSFTIIVETAGNSDALIEGSFTVTVARLSPIANFVVADGGGNTVLFTNTSTGGQPLEFGWDFTNNGSIDSNAENPVFTYAAAGTYTVRLVATNVFGEDTAIQTITVPLTP